MRNSRTIISLLMILIITLMTSCNSSDKNEGQPQVGEKPSYTIILPSKEVRFTVHTPPEESPDRLFLIILPFFDYQILQRVELHRIGYNTYTGSVTLPEGGFIRYAYDKFIPDVSQWSDLYKLREGFSGRIPINYRVLWVNDQILAKGVNDIISTWQDAVTETSMARGTITGEVIDEVNGTPITDATVSIAGVFVPTNAQGKFHLSGVPAGEQRVTVFTTLGDYSYFAMTTAVMGDATTTLSIKLKRARKVHVIFRATTAKELLNSNLYIIGNIYQLGAMYGPFPNWGFTPWESSRFVVMEKKDDYTYQAEFDLYAGTYIRYLYTLAGQFYGEEKKDYDTLFREYMVPETDTVVIEDKLEPFFTPDRKTVELTITPPANTPDGERLYLNIGGPSIPLTRKENGEWGISFPALPGNISFYVFHGFDEMGEAEPLQALDTIHTIDVTDDLQQAITIDQWRYSPPAPASGALYYDLYVTASIPASTPITASVFLLETDANGNALGTTIPTVREYLNPTLTGTLVRNLPGNPFYFKICLNDTNTCFFRTFSVTPKFQGEAFYVAIPYWYNNPSTKEDFISSLYPVDYWRPAFLNLVPSTYERIKEDNAKYVVVTSVWAYGDIFPYPTMEQRPISADNPFTPKEELERAVAIAHEKGLKVIIYPQMNAENHPDWNRFLSTPLSNQWWDKWLECARDLYIYHAWLAEKTGAEALLLPGPFFHVFPQDKNFEDQSYIQVFDSRMESLLEEVRTIYHGKIIVNGRSYVSDSSQQPQFYDFPSKADYIIITSFDMEPSLGVGNNATLEEIKNVLESRVQQYIVPMYNRYHKPVIINYSYPSVDGAANGYKGVSFNIPDDPSIKLDLGEQAILYEAMLEIVEEKTYIGGFMDFGFLHSYAPLNKDYSIRDKPAEAVVRKFYGRW